MHSANRRVFFRGLAFEICENVYEPSEDSFLFAENLPIKKGARVLDVGTGSGLLAIVAASQGASDVLAVDLNPFAARCAKRNAILNGVSNRVSFLQGDLFGVLAEDAKFDLITFNSPYLPSESVEEESWLARAWAGGKTGRQVIDRFISQAPMHLKNAGDILLLQSTLANVETTIMGFERFGLKAEVAAHQKMPFFETLVLVKASFASV